MPEGGTLPVAGVCCASRRQSATTQLSLNALSLLTSYEQTQQQSHPNPTGPELCTPRGLLLCSAAGCKGGGFIRISEQFFRAEKRLDI